MAGLNLGLAQGGTGAGLYEGLAQWLKQRQQTALVDQDLAMGERKMRLEDEDRAAAAQQQASGQQAMQAALQAIEASDLPPLQKLVAKVNLMQGKGLSVPEPKEPRRQFAPDGTLIDVDDPANVGRTFAKPAEAPRAQPQTIRTKDGIQVIDLQSSIGQTFEPEPDKPAAAGGGGNRLDGNQAFSAVMRLNSQFQTNTKATREIERQYGLMRQSWQGLQQGIGKGTAEQAIVSTFNKILDPNSVVREGEYDRTAQGQALLQRMQATAERVASGGQISPQVLGDMVTMAGTYAAQAKRHAQAEQERAGRIADSFGLDRSLIFADQGADEPPQPGPASPDSQAPVSDPAVRARALIEKYSRGRGRP